MINFREKYIDLFNLNEELRATIEPVLDEHPEPEGLKQAFLLYALAKSHKTQAAILLLSEKGFCQDAGILTRSMFELSITASYITQDETGKIVERFFDYDWIMRANMYDSVSKDAIYKEKINKKDSAKEIIEEVLTKAEEIRKKYPDMTDIRWSNKSFKKIARKVGRLDAYKTAYSLQCNLSHPNPRNINDYFTESEGRLEVNSGPDDKWISESLVATFDFFFHIISDWNEEFGFGLKSKLDDLTKRYSVKIKEINKTR